jgi:CubicO group peptidase (beta-lactamase class C family)
VGNGVRRTTAEAKRLLAAGVSGRAFPGAVATVLWRTEGGTERVEATSGRVSPDVGAPPVETGTFFDLGGLTQAVAATCALRLAARRAIDLDARAESVLQEVRGVQLGEATLRDLFRHTAGLDRWGGLYLDVPHGVGTAAARRWVVAEAARRVGETATGESAFSDLGYLIAGELLARVASDDLATLVAREVLEPLGLTDDLLYPAALPADRRARLLRGAAATERCQWRGTLLVGEVQDENAAAMGGVAGHAGLFGRAGAVASFGMAILDVLDGRSAFLPRELQRAALEGESAWRFGWRSRVGAACGRRLGPRAFGVDGFTGCSLWCDPDRMLVIALLTNRISPSRINERIDHFRPAFHDGVLAALES